MDNNQFNQFNQSNPQTGAPMPKNQLFEYIGLGCSCLGALLTVIFSIVTCSRSAVVAEENLSKFKMEFGMSLWVIGVVIAGLITVAGIVFTILAKEKGANLSKLGTIALLVAVAAIIFAIFTNATICSYNCAMNNEFEDMYKGLSSYLN